MACTLAVALLVTPFAPGQRRQGEFSKAASLLEEDHQEHQQVQTIPASAANRRLPGAAGLSRIPAGAHEAIRLSAPPIQGAPSIDCDNAPGIVIHDDGTVENGYGGGPGISVIYADKFTPAVYPVTYTSVCLAFNRQCAAPESYPIEVLVFADDGPGGSPGTELGALPVTMTNIPVFPDPTPVWNSFDISTLNIHVTSGSVYIGAGWSSDSLPQVYMSADENGPGSGAGYEFDSISNAWTPIQNFFPAYRAIFVRAVEQPGGLTAVTSSPSVGGQPTDFGVHRGEPERPETPRASGSLTPRAMTNRFRNPNQTLPGSYTAQDCQYVITQGTDSIVPGNTNIGNNCDECDTSIPLPFNFQLYGATYTSVNVSSNGRLDFVNANEPGGFITACLPSPPNYFTRLPYDNTIFGLWQDLRTDPQPGCAGFPGGECGVFTSVTGSAPNRTFNIEWRAVVYDDNTAPQNFEVRLYENDPNERFDVVLGTLTPPIFAEREWVSGVQGDGNLGFYTEDFCVCPPDRLVQNVLRTYTLTPCSTPSPTPTATPTATPRPTSSPRITPTPRPKPTPNPRS